MFWIGIAAWLLLQWLFVARLPLLSEDWTHRELVGSFTSFFDCFDRSHPPPRPLQHIFFWVMGGAPAWAMRLVPFVMHFASAVAVAALARAAGLEAGRARAAAALFAAFPAVRALAWPAAISGPGHVLFELLALLAFARGRRGSWGSAALVAAATLLAAAWHPSAVLTPLLLVGWRALVAGEGGVVRRALHSLREPAVLAALAVAVLMLAWIMPAPGPRGGVRELGAVAANTARSLVFWLPESVRVEVVALLRAGGGARLGGLAVLAAITACGAVLWWRGGRLWRFGLLVMVADLGLTVLKAGFSMRYAMLPAAVLALACAGLEARLRWRQLLVLLFGLMFAGESVRDTADFVAAGRSAAALLDAATELRDEVPEGRVLWIVDPPPDAGAEGDIPVWNWGLRQALLAHGVLHVRMITTLRSVTSGTDVERVEAAFVAAVMQDPLNAAVRCLPGGRIEVKRPLR